MSDPRKERTQEEPLEKSINHQENPRDRKPDASVEYTREDRQTIRDELPPVYPDSDDE